MAKGRGSRFRYYRPALGRVGREESRNPDRDRIPGHAKSTAELKQRATERRQQRRKARANRVRVEL